MVYNPVSGMEIIQIVIIKKSKQLFCNFLAITLKHSNREAAITTINPTTYSFVISLYSLIPAVKIIRFLFPIFGQRFSLLLTIRSKAKIVAEIKHIFVTHNFIKNISQRSILSFIKNLFFAILSIYQIELHNKIFISGNEAKLIGTAIKEAFQAKVIGRQKRREFFKIYIIKTIQIIVNSFILIFDITVSPIIRNPAFDAILDTINQRINVRVIVQFLFPFPTFYIYYTILIFKSQ